MPNPKSTRLALQSRELAAESGALIRQSDELIKYGKMLMQKLRDWRERPTYAAKAEPYVVAGR